MGCEFGNAQIQYTHTFAFLPNTACSRMQTNTGHLQGKLVIHDTLEPDSKLALKYYNTVMIGKGLDFPDNHSIGYDGYGVDVPLPPPGPLPIFPSAIKKSPRRRSATSLDAPGDSANGRPSGSGSNVGHSNASGPSRHYSTPGPSCHSNAPGPSRPSNAPGPSTSRTAATNTIQSNSEYVSTQPTDIDALLNEALENEKSYVTSMGREDGDGKVDVIITGEVGHMRIFYSSPPHFLYLPQYSWVIVPRV